MKKELVKLVESYNRSTNLDMDFEDSSKLSGIILTHKFKQGMLDILGTINVDNSNQRVRVWSGSPGLGKSTFALMTSNLVSKSHMKMIIEMMNRKEMPSEIDIELKAEFQKFVSNKKSKLLPVFLNGYQGNIEELFISKLGEAFERIGEEKTFNALTKEISKGLSEIIKRWESQAPQLHALYLKELKKRKLEQSVFEAALKKNQKQALSTFHDIHIAMTGDSAHSSISSGDVVKLYKAAVKKLQEVGYSGVFVVYDEFGKFLEKGVQNPSLLNFQFLQDFAEYCDRSGKEQCHLTLITHLSVSQYASQLPITIQKEWAKIEGRFHENSFYDRQTNYYDLIARVFSKNIEQTEPKLYKKVKSLNDDFYSQLKKSNPGLLEILGEDKSVLTKCYPLHPISLLILPVLSQKVAQNERTLYTFLTRNEERSLKKFLATDFSTDDVCFLRPSYLYSYFSPLIAKDIGVGGSYKIHLIVEEALAKVQKLDELSKEIISLIGMSAVLKTINAFSASQEYIQLALGSLYDENEIKKSLKDLENKKILFFNRILSQYELFEGSSIDLEEELNKQRNKKLTSKDLVRLIKNYHQPGFVVPKKYNAENSITRFFRVDYLSVEELKVRKSFEVDFSKEDGLLNYIFAFDKEELEEARSILKARSHNLCAFVISNHYIEAKKDIEELSALNSLFGNKEIVNSSPLVKKELIRHRNILVSSIETLIKPLIGQFRLEVDLYYNGERSNLKDYNHLQRRLGDVFASEYHQYVPFNNEMLNKQKVGGNITLARKQLIDAIIQNPSSKEFGLSGNGPHVTIGKVLRTATGMNYSDNKFVFKDKGFNKLKESYFKALDNSERGLSGAELIDMFISPPFGIRKGMIPLYMSVLDKSMNQPVNHYLDGIFVTKVDGEHYELIVKHPNNCRVFYKELSQEKESFLKAMGTCFNLESVTGVSDVLDGIIQWRKKIAEYVKNSETISVNTKKFLIEVDSAKEPDRLIFDLIPRIYIGKSIDKNASKEDISKCISLLDASMKEAFEHYPILVKEINTVLIAKLNYIRTKLMSLEPLTYKKGINLAEIFQQTFNALPENIQNHPFNTQTAKFIGRIRTFDCKLHPQYFIETVAEALTNSSPRYWDKKGKALFDHALEKCVEELELTCEFLSDKFNGVSAIAFISRLDNKKEFIRLGTSTGLSDDLIPKRQKIEIMLEGLSSKARNEILLSLLSSADKETKKMPEQLNFTGMI